jgi:hypothetical protein
VDGSGKILFGFPEVSRVFVFSKFVKIQFEASLGLDHRSPRTADR